MTQKSWPWSTVAAIGDGSVTLSEAISREFLAAWFLVQDLATEGVSKGVGGELAVTGAASPLAVASGSGVCYGLYINDVATTTPAISTPAVGLTGGRVVLRTSWAAGTTRIAVIKSADGVAAIPALTQVFGTTWEISLATFTITTGGVITVTNAPTFRKSTAVVGASELADSAVTTAKLAAGSVGVAALADLNVTTAKLADLAVTTGKLADDAVTNVKLRESSALSIIGNPGAIANPSDIVATGGTGYVLRESGGGLGFGPIVGDAAVVAEGLTNASMANRTRSFFVPVTLVINGSGVATHEFSGNFSGIILPDAENGQAEGLFSVPADFVSGLTAAPVVIAKATGNLRWSAQAYHDADGEDLGTGGSPATGPTTTACTISKRKVLTALAFPAIAIGDYVSIGFIRDGANVLDTIGNGVVFCGWQISYTADM